MKQLTCLYRPTALAIALLGTLGIANPSNASCGSEDYIGSVCMTAANYCPNGKMEAAGQTLLIQQYTALYSVLGTQYGGNGTTNFMLPDMRGRTPVGVGQGLGLSNITSGTKRGSESITMTEAQLPTHTHFLQAVTTEGSVNAQPGVWLANPQGELRGQVIATAGYAPAGTTSGQVTLNNQSISSAGGNQAVPTLPPQLALRYCVATEGLYPPHP